MKKPNKLLLAVLAIGALGLGACANTNNSTSDAEPTTSELPGESILPSEPETPSEPDVPSEPETPSESEPDVPSEPETPSEPDVPSEPEPEPEPDPIVPPEAISLIGTIGEGTEWTTDYDLTPSEDGLTWTIENFVMEEGEMWKVRMNHNWGTAGLDNWGYSYLDAESKELFTGTDNIEVLTSAYYTVEFVYNKGESVISVTKGEDYVPEIPATVDYMIDFEHLYNAAVSDMTPNVGDAVTLYAIAANDYALKEDSFSLNGEKLYGQSEDGVVWAYTFIIHEVTNTVTGGPVYALGDWAFASQTINQNRAAVLGEVGGEEAIAFVNNEADLQNIIVKDAGDLKGELAYSMSAFIKTEQPTPNDMEEPRDMGFGFVPYYVDDENWFSVYCAYWAGDRPYEVRTVSIDGRINGELLHVTYGWTEAWANGSAFNPQNGVLFEVTRARADYHVTVTGEDDEGNEIVLDRTVTVNSELAKVETEKFGFHSYGCGTTVCAYIETQVEEDRTTEGYVKVSGNWGGCSTYYVNGDGELVYNLANADNWKSGMVLIDNDDVKGSKQYTITANITSSVGAPITATEMAIGFCVYYVDDSNFLNAFIQWHRDEKAGWVRQINIVGTINGNDAGWNDCWAFDNLQLDPSQEFVLTAERNGDIFTFQCGDRNGEVYINDNCRDLPATNKVGVWGNMNGVGGTITYANLTVVNNAQ